jgi:GT2 family glycosyltransferase
VRDILAPNEALFRLLPGGKLISIVIVNWNSGKFLENCVLSLLKNAGGCEIIVVDNASADSSLQFIARTEADIKVLRNDRNMGFAAANNLGWRASKGSRILFLNPDIECLPESISRLSQQLAADHTVWAIGGHLVSPSGKSQAGFNVKAFPTVGRVVAEMLFLDEIWPAHLSFRRTASSQLAVDVDQPAAACLMVARTALEAVGGFDETFRPAWFEDVDLCRRIRDLGGRIQYHPAARFLHHGGHSLSQMTRERFLESFHTNQIRYFRKHHGRRSAGRVKRWIVVGLLLRSAVSIVRALAPRETRLSSARTFWKAARHIRKTLEDES